MLLKRALSLGKSIKNAIYYIGDKRDILYTLRSIRYSNSN